MTIAEFIAKYNNASTGLFRAGQTRGIESVDMREFVTDITTITDLPSSAVNPHWRGAYDASVDAYPSAGAGSGTAGAILSGDLWYVSVQGDIDVEGLGVITVFPGALIIALIDTPGTTPANFKVIQ